MERHVRAVFALFLGTISVCCSKPFVCGLRVLWQRPPTFLAPGASFVEDNFSMDEKRDGFRMIQVHNIYSALYFYYYYISSTSGHQAVAPGGWRPLS